MRMIDVEPIIKNLSAMETQLGYDAISIDGMLKALREAEEVGSAPVVHGRWIPYENEQDKGFHYCSVCKGQAFNYEDGSEIVEVLSNYCPKCGAKMDLP